MAVTVYQLWRRCEDRTGHYFLPNFGPIELNKSCHHCGVAFTYEQVRDEEIGPCAPSVGAKSNPLLWRLDALETRIEDLERRLRAKED